MFAFLKLPPSHSDHEIKSLHLVTLIVFVCLPHCLYSRPRNQVDSFPRAGVLLHSIAFYCILLHSNVFHCIFFYFSNSILFRFDMHFHLFCELFYVDSFIVSLFFRLTNITGGGCCFALLAVRWMRIWFFSFANVRLYLLRRAKRIRDGTLM